MKIEIDYLLFILIIVNILNKLQKYIRGQPDLN